MALDGGFYEVLGVGVRGPAPVGRAYLELNPGVVALYGLNGAGKSRLLAGIEAALAGRHTGGIDVGDVWVRVLDPMSELSGDELRHPLVVAIAEAATEQVRESWGGAEFQEFDERDRLAAVGAFGFIEEHRSLAWILRSAMFDFLDLGGDDNDEFSDATESIATEGLLHLRALQSPDPGWEVRPAGHTDWMIEGGFASGFLASADYLWRALADEVPMEGFRAGQWIFLRGANLIGHSLAADRWTMIGTTPARLSVARPSWAAVEVGPAGQLATPVVNVVRLGDAGANLDVETLAAALLVTKTPLLASDGEELVIDPALTEFLAGLGARASNLCALFLSGAPELRCELAHPNEWLSGPGLGWHALDPWRRSPLPLPSLSAAQRKWAEVSIRLALLGTQSAPTVLLLDEPEASLHRAAEHHLIAGLVRLAAEEQLAVIVATHSPVFLGHPAVTKLHVARSADGHAGVAALDAHLDEEQAGISAVSAALGIGVGDLLQMVRCFLVVEGEHDYVVFDELFGPELRRSLIRIAPLRGARNLGAVINAQLLFDFTDAPICLVLDHLRAEDVDPIWAKAIRATTLKRQEEVLATLDRLEGKEALWLRELGTRAARSGSLGRIWLATLSEPDIICYLPPESFNLADQSWDELGTAYRSDRSREDLDFKSWLRKRHGANVSPTKVRSAVRRLDTIPDDLLRVSARALEVAGMGWART